MSYMYNKSKTYVRYGIGVRKYYEVRRKVETGICNDPWLFNILFDSG